MNIRIGNGYDVHPLAEGLPFFLGGVQIEFEKGCVAHSDGDTLIHALCDALLGALALGDIGKHFPDSDQAYKGIDSKVLLRKTYKMICEQGYRLVNADCTICLQAPKVGRYIPQMQRVLAEVLCLGEADAEAAAEAREAAESSAGSSAGASAGSSAAAEAREAAGSTAGRSAEPDAMAAAVSRVALGLEAALERATTSARPQAISIKATTTEHLGFVGRGEGIAVYATVLLEKVG